MSEVVTAPRAPGQRACKRISSDIWASFTREQHREYRRTLLTLRRAVQLRRAANRPCPRSSSIAEANRRTGRPRGHTREIERRERQSANAKSG